MEKFNQFLKARGHDESNETWKSIVGTAEQSYANHGIVSLKPNDTDTNNTQNLEEKTEEQSNITDNRRNNQLKDVSELEKCTALEVCLFLLSYF